MRLEDLMDKVLRISMGRMTDTLAMRAHANNYNEHPRPAAFVATSSRRVRCRCSATASRRGYSP